MTNDQNTQTPVNDTATCGPVDTALTQPRSLDVRATRASLIAMRVKLGADTPAGHRCSNLVEQLKGYATATADARFRLEKLIQRTMAELSELTRASQ